MLPEEDDLERTPVDSRDGGVIGARLTDGDDRPIFLWGLGPPVPQPSDLAPRRFFWWTQYRSALRLGSAAIEELAASSYSLLSILPDPLDWAARPTPFKGLVVGAIQSGKTASMMGLAAVALDHGYRIVIALAGTKDDLRRQTARRFNTQLLRQSDRIFGANGLTTLGRPQGKGPLGGFAPPYGFDTNQFSLLQIRMEDALRHGEPCVVVVKKNVASLSALHGALEYLFRQFGVEGLPMLIMDDECDDASVESNGAQIPIAIANLWRSEGARPRVAYVGYTATAAANIIQHPDNDLYPSHFAFLLRYPGESETAIQFKDRSSESWYTGGDCFYGAFGDEPGDDENFLVVPTVKHSELLGPVEANSSLKNALRAYFVAGAYRLVLEPQRGFENAQQTPRPHTMLIQTSASLVEHRSWARGIQQLVAGVTLPDKSIQPTTAQLLRELADAEDEWRTWYESFERSRERVYRERPHPGIQRAVAWDQVKERLGAVFENTRLKVVNSDESVGTDLDFSPRLTVGGEELRPQDCYVIVVGGARLSRGITLEGLCISYFTRLAPNPTEDTVQQLSRWFGYRGPYLEFCRLFCTRAVFESLREMNENDIDLRYQLAELMAAGKPLSEAILILRASPRAAPTAKMGDVSINQVAFSPYTTLMRCVECSEFAGDNEEAAHRIVHEIRRRAGQQVRSASGTRRGLLSRGWTVSEVADLLDVFEYSYHNPENASQPLARYYRAPDPNRTVATGMPALYDPYQLAAYLRAWAAGEDERAAQPPSFNVGLVYGEMNENCFPFDFALLNREINDANEIVAGLTGPSAHWAGDAYFDNPSLRYRMAGGRQRLQGSEGLLLLYVVHKDAVGRAGRGKIRRYHTPTWGVSIPSGGPVFRRAVIAPRQSV